MKIRTEKVIDMDEWDEMVKKTYKRPYSLQQQDGCKSKGTSVRFKVPDDAEDYERDSVSEIDSNLDNYDERGVSFAAWLKRDPQTPLINQKYDFELEMWWERNFYPDIQMIANDLHDKKLLKAGEYAIHIDW